MSSRSITKRIFMNDERTLDSFASALEEAEKLKQNRAVRTEESHYLTKDQFQKMFRRALDK